jgi:hypothetical protein
MSLKTYKDEKGVIVIEGDEKLLAKIEGQSLVGIDVSDIRLDADNLAEVFDLAVNTPNEPNNTKRYAVLKQKYLEKFSK